MIEKYLIADNLYGGLNTFRPLFKRISMFKSNLPNAVINQDKSFSDILEKSLRFNSKSAQSEFIDKENDQDNDNNELNLPDTSQMIPFCPKPEINGYYDPLYPVPGGRIIFPNAIEQLLTELPPKRLFIGPHVKVDELMNFFNSNSEADSKTFNSGNLSRDTISNTNNDNNANKNKTERNDPGVEHIIEYLAKEEDKISSDFLNNENKAPTARKSKGYFDIYFRRRHLKL